MQCLTIAGPYLVIKRVNSDQQLDWPIRLHSWHHDHDKSTRLDLLINLRDRGVTTM